MSQTPTSPLDDYKDFILAVLDAGLNYQAIADALRNDHGTDTSRHSVRRAVRRWNYSRSDMEVPAGPERPSSTVTANEAHIVSRPGPASELNDPEALLLERDLDPEDWEVVNLTLNEWDSLTGDTLKQLKIYCKRKRGDIALVLPARTLENYKRPGASLKMPKGPALWAFIGDHQAPYHDLDLHALTVEWLAHTRPDHVVIMGDLIDLPDVSRWPDNPEWHERAQVCVDAGHLILLDYVEATPGTEFQMLLGNHDERIRNEQLTRAERLYGLRPALEPGKPEEHPLLSIRRLLHLDKLGINLIEPKGSYKSAQVKVCDQLAARHGWLTSQNAARKSTERLEHSLIIGHTHRRSHAVRTVYDIDRHPREIHSVETGAMCRIEEGIGFAVDPDWANGFATASVWDDGDFTIEHARYERGSLRWRDEHLSL